MTTSKKDAAGHPDEVATEYTNVAVPAIETPVSVPEPGRGQKVVTSPTGIRSVVDESAVEALLTQGYTVGK